MSMRVPATAPPAPDREPTDPDGQTPEPDRVLSEPDRALRAPWHLACVEGPDVGAVVGLTETVTLGRSGRVSLQDASASRHHAEVAPASGTGHARGRRRQRRGRTRGGPGAPVAWVRDLGSANGTRVQRARLPRLSGRAVRGRTLRGRNVGGRGPGGRGPGGRGLPDRTWVPLRPGDRVIIGRNQFEVRPRPLDLSWPEPDPPRRRHLAMAGVPLAMMAAFGIWRIASLPGGEVRATVWMLAACAALVGAGLAARLLVRRRRRWHVVDAAALAVALPGLSAPAPSGPSVRPEGTPSVAPDTAPSIWPASAGPRAGLPVGERIGFVGDHARLAARWWCAQIAMRTGGATVSQVHGAHCEAPRVLGDGHVPIHVVAGPSSDACPACEAGPPVPAAWHVGVSATFGRLPPWCETVVAADTPLTSETWWQQVAPTQPTAAGELPDVVAWEDRAPSGDVCASGSLAVVLGHDRDGPVSVDLAGQGPHALVAGTTGSGKSEALMTWMLALAEAHRPDRLRLVLLDYKGGATFAPLSGLPHTEAVLTDLDPGATDRAIRGLGALLVRRERDLARLGLPDLARWQQAFDRGHAPEPPPRIVVAVDEFRVLAESHPDTLEALVRLASQGRSLGLHLVLATQRPAGAVSAAMRANIEIRLALRCADDADSVDLLGTPEAARLPRLPGRAVLRGHGVLQVAWAADPGRQVVRIARRWASADVPADALWAPPLPDELTREFLDTLVPPTGTPAPVAIGLVDALGGTHGTPHVPDTRVSQTGTTTQSHAALWWTGSHVRFDRPRHAAQHVARAAVAAGARLGQHLGVPVHVCSGAPRGPGEWATWIDVEDAGACAHLLEGVCARGPAVLVVDDVEAVVSALDAALGPGRGGALWTQVLTRAARCGVQVVAAGTGQWGAASGAASTFGLRLARIEDRDDAVRAGLPPATPRCVPAGRFVLASSPAAAVTTHGRSGVPPLVQVPLEVQLGVAAGPPPDPQPWGVRSLLDDHPPGPAGTIARVGASLRPLAAGPGQRWLVVAEDPDLALCAIERAHRQLGLPVATPVRADDPNATSVLTRGPRAADPARSHLQQASAMARDSPPGTPAGSQRGSPWGSPPNSPQDSPQTVVLDARDWMQIRRWSSTHRVLALDPDPDVLRALLQVARRPEVAVMAERWHPHTGVLADHGRVMRVWLQV